MSITPFEVRTASRKRAKIKLGLAGSSGSGKTYSSLLLARSLVDDWGEIVLIDTENGSGELYSELGKYKIINFKPPYSPENYISAIDAAVNAGAKVIVVDSISHEWNGEGGILELSEKMPGNSFQNWMKLTPRHNQFLQKILNTQLHFICTLRKKTDYVMEKDDRTGKMQVKKKGLKEVQREGTDYEFTIVFDLDHDHNATVSKDRTGQFENYCQKITVETGKKIREWCDSGESNTPSIKLIAEIKDLFDELSVAKEQQKATLLKFGFLRVEEMTKKAAENLKTALEKKQRIKKL